MRHFDVVGPYWGNISKPIINAGNGRLNARSVKIFADGEKATLCIKYIRLCHSVV
jgi:hypothetical protein